MDNKPTYDELAIAVRGYEEECKALKAHVARLREALEFACADDMWVSNGKFEELFSYTYLEWYQDVGRQALSETPSQSLNHIKARVEEETIERCADIAAGTYEGTDYSEFNCVDFYGKCSAAAITVMPRKYTNQLEAGKLPTAKEKEDEQ